MKEIEIEIDIKDSIEKLLEKLSSRFHEKQISIDIKLNRNGEGKDYFSEIEVTFWQNNNVLDVISVIIYANGKLRDTKESFLEWLKEEISNILK